jgi:hypothetical protein
MKLSFSHLAVVSFALVVSGCASLTGIDPSMLDKTTKTNRVEIEKSYFWEERFNISSMSHNLTLKAGTYNAYLDDKRGTYYEGEGLCLEWKFVYDDETLAPKTYNYRCGVYVPNDNKMRAKVYYYIDPEESKKTMDATNPGALIRALDKAEWDNLKHLMYQPDEQELRSAINIIK